MYAYHCVLAHTSRVKSFLELLFKFSWATHQAASIGTELIRGTLPRDRLLCFDGQADPGHSLPSGGLLTAELAPYASGVIFRIQSDFRSVGVQGCSQLSDDVIVSGNIRHP